MGNLLKDFKGKSILKGFFYILKIVSIAAFMVFLVNMYSNFIKKEAPKIFISSSDNPSAEKIEQAIDKYIEITGDIELERLTNKENPVDNILIELQKRLIRAEDKNGKVLMERPFLIPPDDGEISAQSYYPKWNPENDGKNIGWEITIDISEGTSEVKPIKGKSKDKYTHLEKIGGSHNLRFVE